MISVLSFKNRMNLKGKELEKRIHKREYNDTVTNHRYIQQFEEWNIEQMHQWKEQWKG